MCSFMEYKVIPSHIQTDADSETKQHSIWRELPDVPCNNSSPCVVDGVLLAIGGNQRAEGHEKTSAIHAFHPVNKKWMHIGNLPFACSYVDTLLLSNGGLLVVDGDSQKVVTVIAKGKMSKTFFVSIALK